MTSISDAAGLPWGSVLGSPSAREGGYWLLPGDSGERLNGLVGREFLIGEEGNPWELDLQQPPKPLSDLVTPQTTGQSGTHFADSPTVYSLVTQRPPGLDGSLMGGFKRRQRTGKVRHRRMTQGFSGECRNG